VSFIGCYKTLRAQSGSETQVRSKLLITLLIGILVVVYCLLGIDYMKQRQEHAVLTTRIADARQTLAQLPEPPQNLEERLAAAEARLSAAQSSFPARLNSTQVVNHILELAKGHNVTAIPLVTEAWSTEKVRQHEYQVFRLNVAVAGSYPQLVAFVNELENGENEILVVKDLSVTRVTGQSEDKNVSGGTISITASLELSIYTQPPTPD